MPRISAPMCLVSGTTSRRAAPDAFADTDSCVASDICEPPHSSCCCLFRGDRHCRRRQCVRGFTARQCGKNSIDQGARGIGAKLHRDAVAPALAFIGEVDGQHVIEGGVIRMIVIDVGGIDLHPALAALSAADKSGLFDDVGAHGSPPYSAAMLEAEAARLRLKKSNHLRQPSMACSGR